MRIRLIVLASLSLSLLFSNLHLPTQSFSGLTKHCRNCEKNLTYLFDCLFSGRSLGGRHLTPVMKKCKANA